MNTVSTASTPAIDGLADDIRRLAEPGDGELAVEFARLFLAHAPAAFFAGRSTETLAAVVTSAFMHLQHSRPAAVDVAVVQPEDDVLPWSATATVIRASVSERPFVVDSIREYLRLREMPIERLLHPVLRVVRDDAGRIMELGAASEAGPHEALIHCEVARLEDAEARRTVAAQLTRVLGDVVAATRNGPVSRSRCCWIPCRRRCATALRPAAAHHQQDEFAVHRASRRAHGLRRRQEAGRSRSHHRRAPVHRAVHVPRLRRGCGAHPDAATEAARDPRAGGWLPGSHDYKEAVTIFNSMPKEELFLASAGGDRQADRRHPHALPHAGGEGHAAARPPRARRLHHGDHAEGPVLGPGPARAAGGAGATVRGHAAELPSRHGRRRPGPPPLLHHAVPPTGSAPSMPEQIEQIVSR
jgi:phenylpyruvate tautomerase PptA (4-oxalocrotonate tautomerase family)